MFSFCHAASWARCLTPNSWLIRSWVSRPSKPLCLLANGWSWSACMFSTWTHEGQPEEKPQLVAPEAMGFLLYSSTCFQVWVALLGSSPAFWNASLLWYRIGVEELNGIE